MALKPKFYIQIKWKFLLVITLVMGAALVTFFQKADTLFSNDKKVFIMDLNLALLKATASEVKHEIKRRVEDLQIFSPRVYNRVVAKPGSKWDPYQGLTASLRDELISVTFYRKKLDGKFSQIRKYVNRGLLKKRAAAPNLPAVLNQSHPVDLGVASKGLVMLNRSIPSSQQGANGIPVLTFLFNGSLVDSGSKDVVIVVNMISDFLVNKLRDTDVAEVFLVKKDGHLLSHPDVGLLVSNSTTAFAHPVIQKLKKKHFAKAGSELVVNGEAHQVNFSMTSFDGVYVVSQIKNSEAFNALADLRKETTLTALLIFFAGLAVSILFTATLTANIHKLKKATQELGDGKLGVKLQLRSYDEIQEVAENFNWMSNRLVELMNDTAGNARMENELKTARLVQSTLLTTPKIESADVKLASHLVPASECGGDFWDAHIHGKTLTVIIGDATGHGAPAALVTAVAKACFSTLNTVYYDRPLSPDQFLETLNSIVYGTCQGQLLMTMCILQLDLQTGKLCVANAGHESPFRLKTMSEGSVKGRADTLFTRGERLGFSEGTTYSMKEFQLTPGEIVLLYTDGITEAHDKKGKEWGERSLRKALAGKGPRPLATIKDELISAVTTHIGDTAQEDDITFVMVKWKELGDVVQVPAAPQQVAAEPVQNVAPVEAAAAAAPAPVTEQTSTGMTPAPESQGGFDQEEDNVKTVLYNKKEEDAPAGGEDPEQAEIATQIYQLREDQSAPPEEFEDAPTLFADTEEKSELIAESEDEEAEASENKDDKPKVA